MTRARANDTAWMTAALAIGRRGMGNTGPNPSVGCVIVRDESVIGQGHTQPGGRPHAEVQALGMAGKGARGADVFVTLEPCAHVGQTGPCAQALIDAGVERVVVALLDPDPRVAGQGLRLLQHAGIEVQVGLMAEFAAFDLAGYLRTRTPTSDRTSDRAETAKRALPWVTLKLATTLDGKIALGHGESKWITGPLARRWGHLLRAQHDAIVTGARTVRADDPALTARVPGLVGQDPQPYVLSSHEGIAGNYQLLAGGGVVLTANDGARLPDPVTVLEQLAQAGHTRVMIEAGSGVAALFLNANLVDQIALFQAPALIGREGLNAVGSLDIEHLTALVRWDVVDTVSMDQERYLTLRHPNWHDEVAGYV